MSGHAKAVASHARQLFLKRAEMARQLARLDAQLDAANRSYSAATGYRMTLRIEDFRNRVAG